MDRGGTERQITQKETWSSRLLSRNMILLVKPNTKCDMMRYISHLLIQTRMVLEMKPGFMMTEVFSACLCRK